MMDPIVWPFIQQVQTVSLHPPEIPYISNVTGTWITAEEATNPSYWGRQLRQTVRFADGLQALLTDPQRLFLEVGPGQTLSTLARQQPGHEAERVFLSSIRAAHDQQSDVAFLLNTLGRLWLCGMQVDWYGFAAHERRQRIPLPTYPFERQSYWIGLPESQAAGMDAADQRGDQDVADLFYLPTWKLAAPSTSARSSDRGQVQGHWLVFSDADGLGSQLVKRLETDGQEITSVVMGEQYARLDAHTYAIRPQQRDDYEALLTDLRMQTKAPDTIVHLWSVTPTEPLPSDAETFQQLHTGASTVCCFWRRHWKNSTSRLASTSALCQTRSRPSPATSPCVRRRPLS